MAYEGHQPLDLVGPLQVFALANRESHRTLYEIVVAAERKGLVHTASGPTIHVSATLGALRGADTIIVPGGPGVSSATSNPALLDAIRSSQGAVRRLCSVCTGAFLLAEAGVLKGRRVTTHWQLCAELARRYSDLEVLASPIFVRDRDIWTSAGVTAGIDLALALVEMDHGYDLAATLSRNLVVYLRRPGGQAQFSEPLSLQQRAASGGYAQLLEKISSSLRKSWSVAELAAAAGQSTRTFQRKFRAAMQRTPLGVVESIRVTQARLLFETTRTAPALIASRCGFGSVEHMRRAFHRQIGIAPGKLRSLFGKDRLV